MKFFDYIRFGLKNIWRQKVRTFLTIFAVVIGATSVVLMLTIIFGAKQTALDQIKQAGALTQVSVSSNTDMRSDDVFNGSGGGSSADSTKLTDELLAKVAVIPHVTDAYAQAGAWNLRSATLEGGDGKAVGMDQMIAYEPDDKRQKPMAAGRNLASDDVDAVIIGQDTLQKLGYKDKASEIIGKNLQFKVQGYTGDDVPPMPPQMNNKEENDQYWKSQQEHFGVVNVSIVGVMTQGPYDNASFIPMAFARKEMTNNQWQQEEQKNQFDSKGHPLPQGPPKFTLVKQSQLDQQGYSSFVLNVDTLDNVDPVVAQVKTMKLGAASAKSIIDQILQIFKMISIVFGAIGGIALLVAAIGVVNTMVMATLERTREIGVMRACGATKAAVRRLFTFEAALLGFWGGILGCAVAYGATRAVIHFAGSQLTKQGIPLSVLNIPPWLALTTIAVTTILGLLAGYGPAIRAARLNPVEALRYE